MKYLEINDDFIIIEITENDKIRDVVDKIGWGFEYDVVFSKDIEPKISKDKLDELIKRMNVKGYNWGKNPISLEMGFLNNIPEMERDEIITRQNALYDFNEKRTFYPEKCSILKKND